MSTVLSAKKTSATITTQNLNPNSGAPTAGSFAYTKCAGYGTLTIQTFGTYTGALTVQVRLDGTNWISLGGSAVTNVNAGTQSATIASATQGIFQVDVSGYPEVRVTALAAVTGSVVVTMYLTEAPSIFGIDTPMPTSTVNLGTGGTSATSLGKAEDAAHASGDTMVGVLGVRYETNNASPVSAANDYGFMQIDDLGKQVVMPYAPPVNQVQGITAAMTATTSTAVIAAAGASIRNYITDVTLINTHATVGTEIDLLDGATIVGRFYVPALSTLYKTFGVPLKGTANTAFNAQNVTTGSNTFVQATGFKAI